MLAHLSIGDTAAAATLLTLTIASIGGLVLGYLKLARLHDDVNDVQDSLRLPSNPEKSIAAELEGVAQSFHFLAQLFEDQIRKDRERGGGQSRRWKDGE